MADEVVGGGLRELDWVRGWTKGAGLGKGGVAEEVVVGGLRELDWVRAEWQTKWWVVD